MANSILVEVKDKVKTITINRPEVLNALNVELLTELRTLFLKLAQEKNLHEEVRVVVLRGAGGKAFVAGADIKYMQGASRVEREEFAKLGQSTMLSIEHLPVPVIAVVDGFALGGGMELALACDLVAATEKSKFGQPEVNLGLIPGFGGTQRLIYRCGLATTKRLVFTGEHVSASEAFNLGLVDYLLNESELEQKLSEIVQSICSKAPIAVAVAKRAIEFAVKDLKAEGLKHEMREFLTLFLTADTTEGLNAFLEKRKAKFCGN